MNIKMMVDKIVRYLLFALSLSLLLIPSIMAYLLGTSLRYGLETSEFISVISWFLLCTLLSYLCYKLSKVKEISFSFLFFLFPIQILIISGTLNLLISNDKVVSVLSLFIIPSWVWISLKIYQIYKSRIRKAE